MNIIKKECITHSNDINGIIKIEGTLTTILFNLVILKRQKVNLSLCKKDLEFLCLKDGISMDQAIKDIITQTI